jgi:hypothetical protein
MTLTALVGALLALVPAAPKPKPKPKHELEIERLSRRVETLEYDLESAGRELAAERLISTHWIGEASRIAKQAREERERRDGSRHAALYAQHDAQQAQAFGFCNCVPSRTQMFDAIAQLNPWRR